MGVEPITLRLNCTRVSEWELKGSEPNHTVLRASQLCQSGRLTQFLIIVIYLGLQPVEKIKNSGMAVGTLGSPVRCLLRGRRSKRYTEIARKDGHTHGIPVGPTA